VKWTSVFRERARRKEAFVVLATSFFPTFLAAFTMALNGEGAEAITSSYDEIHISAT